MGTMLLLGVLIFLAVMFYMGFKKGILRILLSFVSTIVAFMLAMFLSSPIENFIKNNTSVYNSMKKQMTVYVEDYIEEGIDLSDIENQKKAIKKLELPSVIKDKLIDENISKDKTDLGVEKFSELIAASLADILIQAAVVIVLYLIIKIIFRVVISVLNIISRLPLIGELNKSLGGILGIVEGVLVLWVLCIALTALSGTDTGEQILSAISSNSILNFIYSNNIIMKILL